MRYETGCNCFQHSSIVLVGSDDDQDVAASRIITNLRPNMFWTIGNQAPRPRVRKPIDNRSFRIDFSTLPTAKVNVIEMKSLGSHRCDPMRRERFLLRQRLVNRSFVNLSVCLCAFRVLSTSPLGRDIQPLYLTTTCRIISVISVIVIIFMMVK